MAGDDIDDSLNSDDDVEVDGSFNEDNSEANIDASDDDTAAVEVEDSYNEDNDEADVNVNSAA